MTDNKNRGYDTERAVAKKVGLQSVPFSGSRFDRGREDAQNDDFLAQIKSSKASMAMPYSDAWLLCRRADRLGKLPVILFYGLSTENIPEQLWVAVPVDYLEKFYEIGYQFTETDEEK